VDCIYEYIGDDKGTYPNQLYIHPDECIDCGACEPECPWQAIFEEAAVPEIFKDDTPLNYSMVQNASEFRVKKHEQKPKPTADEIEANKRKWSYGG
jgi:ferredoxin